MLSESEIEAIWDILRRLAKVYSVDYTFIYRKPLGVYMLTVYSGTLEFTECISETHFRDVNMNSLRFIEMVARRMAEDLHRRWPHRFSYIE